MKNIILILLTLFITSSYSQRKKDILYEISDYKKNIVSNATFDKDESEVWNAMYIIATEEYNTIVRESESKGYIEAKQETDTFKEFFTIEMKGERPYRVSFQVKQEKRTKNPDGSYTNWATYNSSTLNSYFNKLRLYELLNGKLEISEDLQEKVDNFNNEQKKDRLKIIKGKDY